MPVVVGIVKEAAMEYFDLTITMTPVCAQGKDGAEFSVWTIAESSPTPNPEAFFSNGDFRKKSKLPVSLTPIVSPRCPFSGRSTDKATDLDAHLPADHPPLTPSQDLDKLPPITPHKYPTLTAVPQLQADLLRKEFSSNTSIVSRSEGSSPRMEPHTPTAGVPSRRPVLRISPKTSLSFSRFNFETPKARHVLDRTSSVGNSPGGGMGMGFSGDMGLSGEQVMELFPFHFMLHKATMLIVQSGELLASLLSKPPIDTLVADVFSVCNANAGTLIFRELLCRLLIPIN